VGSRIWVSVPKADYGEYRLSEQIHGPYRVTGFREFYPADPPGPEQKRAKHLVQIYTDPGGMRTLSLGSICFRDPRRRRDAA